MELIKPTLSVIIPHHRGRDLIERCLRSVAASEGVEVETIVVTSDISYLPEGVKCYFLEDGPAAKRNLGVRHATGDTLIFLDDDVEVSPYCCYELWKFLQDTPKCGMVFGKIYKMEEGRRDEFDAAGSWLTWTGFLWDRAGNRQVDTGQFASPDRCLASKSATCAIPGAVFSRVGGFDALYYILGEETDLAWRLWLRGWECWYVPTAVSWHAFGCESLKPKQDYYTIERTMTYGCRNYLSLLWTNLGTCRLLWTLPVHLSAWTLSVCGFFLRGDYSRAMGIVRGLSAFVRHLPHVLRKRHVIQSTRTIRDRDLWPIISRSPGLTYYLQRLTRYWTSQLHG